MRYRRPYLGDGDAPYRAPPGFRRGDSPRSWQRGRLAPWAPVLLAGLTVGAVVLAYRVAPVRVTVSFDGQTAVVESRAGTVGALLLEQHIPVIEGDLVLPSPDARLDEGSRVVVQRARPVVVRADGRVVRVRSHGRSAEDVLAQAGLSLGTGDRLWVNGRHWTFLRSAPDPLADAEVPQLASAAPAGVPRLRAPPAPDRSRTLGQAEDAPRGPTVPLLPGGDDAATEPPLGEPPLLPGSAPEWVLEVHRGVPVTLIDEGVPIGVVLAGARLDDAIVAAGIPLFPEDAVMPARDAPVASGMTVAITRATPFLVEVDESSRELRALAVTVGEALHRAGYALAGRDYSVPAADAPLTPGVRVQIVRVVEDFLVEELPIPYGTETVADAALQLDQTRVDRAGVPGLKTRRTRIVYENGQEVARDVEEETVLQAPVNEILAYGTNIVWLTVDTASGPVRYWRKLRMYATSYSASRAGTPKSAPWYGRTRLGWQMRKGIVAVDPRVIPLTTNLFVPGYGLGVAGDTGGGVRNYHLDLGFDDDNYESWHQYVDVYLIEPLPNDIPWILP